VLQEVQEKYPLQKLPKTHLTLLSAYGANQSRGGYSIKVKFKRNHVLGCIGAFK
jgi:hypothetical protein